MIMITLLLILNFFLMLLLPVLLARFLHKRYKVGWALFGVGATTFVASQIGHIPFNLLVQNAGWLPNDLSSWWGLGITAVFFGLSAGLFEESARYVTLRFWATDDRNWRSGMMLGAGHGGIEAMLLGLIGLINFAVLLGLKNGALLNIVSAAELPLVELQIETMFGLPWHMTLLGAVERLFALSFHLSASLLVMQVFVRGQTRWLFAAVGWHTLLNAVAVIGAVRWTPLMTEGMIGILALISFGIIYVLRGSAIEEPALVPLPDPEPIRIKKGDVTADMLDKSRYS
jgi:uncharacterized membrane protein YhfC